MSSDAADAAGGGTFAGVHLHAALLGALPRLLGTRAVAPLPLQWRAVPRIARAVRRPLARDVLCAAPTGSGKTLCYLLPVLDALLRAEEAGAPVAAAWALVLVPSAALVRQAVEAATTLLGRRAARVGVVALAGGGGGAWAREAAAVRAGARLVVSTPTRWLDHAALGAPPLLVLDEADALAANAALAQHVARLGGAARAADDDLFRARPHAATRKLAFSATLTRDETALVRLFGLHRAVTVLGGERALELPPQLRLARRVCRSDAHKLRIVVRLLGAADAPRALVFVNTLRKCAWLTAKLRKAGLDAREFSSALSVADRAKALRDFRVLACTDAAARGLDLPDVGLVVHFEHAPQRRTFIHRAGRTARAGAPGESLALLFPKEVRHYNLCLGAQRKRDATTTNEDDDDSDDDITASRKKRKE